MGDVVNIGAGNAGDAFYRYKMPKLQSKVEGRGNGVKTNVMNMVEVAKALGRPASYTTKYFGCALGAQSRYNEGSGLSIVNGAHNTQELAQTLEGFIKTFVQCYKCGNPETVMAVDKRENITMTCKACGFVSKLDPRHKLNTYIIKNPPKAKASKSEKSLRRAEKEREAVGEALDAESKKKKKKSKEKDKDKDGKKEKKSKKDKKDKKDKPATGSPEPEEPEESEEEEEEGDDDVEWSTDTSAAATAARARDQLSEATAAMVTAEVTEAAEGLSLEESPADRVAALVAKGGDAAAVKAALSEAGPGQARASALVSGVLRDAPDKGLAKIMEKRKALLALGAGSEAAQADLLAALEHFVGVAKPSALGEIGFALKALYDEDLVEEDAINAWHADGEAAAALGVTAADAAKVRKFSAPFVQWLAMEDSDEDSDEESDEEE